MTFSQPAFLLLLMLPVGWLVTGWRSGPARLLLLKCLAIAAVAIALARPAVTYREPKIAVALLVDTSASITAADLETESQIVSRIRSASGTNPVQVIPFARHARALTNQEVASNKLTSSIGPSARATDIESAVGSALAAMPAGAARHLVLVSDGNENSGSVARAAWQLQQVSVPVDVFPLAGRARPRLHVESVSAPEQVFSGERFPLEISVTAPESAAATIELQADGRKIGAEPVNVEPGLNHLTINTALNTTGALELSGTVSAARLGRAPFLYAISVRQPRVLLVSSEPAEADASLEQALAANQFLLDHRDQGLPSDLAPYQLVILNNQDLEKIPLADQARLETFEKQGGGILWIAGDRNVYVERHGAPERPLERALPAKIAKPRSPKGTAVILIIDKSSSMEGRKIELARLASIGVVQNLKPEDWIAVLIFDNSFEWAVQMQKASDKAAIQRLIGGITPDGGTQIAPALAEAFRKIQPVDAVYKHIVLLTDGISEEGDSLELARQAAIRQVTISTVGLGQDVNRSYLEKIASNANGKSYFLLEPAGLEQILLKDVQEHTGQTAVEKPQSAAMKMKADILDGVDVAEAPQLKGYVRFDARPDAATVLGIDRDPLLVRWQFGLGRAAVFTSDAKNRWASDWLKWKGFDRFWTNVARDLLPHAPSSQASSNFDAGRGDLVVTYNLSDQTTEPANAPDIFALGPSGFRQPTDVSKISSGVYKARVHIGSKQGLFRVRPLAESRAFPEVGFYRQETEMTDFGTNEQLLRQLAAVSGGRVSPEPREIFDAREVRVATRFDLWPLFLILALALNFAELIARKWKGIREWLPRSSAA